MVSDLHASNACFRKCIRLVADSEADVLVIAGDFVGKRVVRLIKRADGRTDVLDGDAGRQSLTAEELDESRSRWADSGLYSAYVDDRETPAPEIDALLERAAERRLAQWFDYGAKVLPPLPVIVVPGNDDPSAVVQVLSEHGWVTNVDGVAVEWDGLEFFGMGYSNYTPWRTPRELTESEICARLEAVRPSNRTGRQAIGVIHVPPYDSGLDSVPQTEWSASGELTNTGRRLVSCGSTAVRGFIEAASPALALSGHCHSSPGVTKVGTTVCVNPGSNFDKGELCAMLLVLDAGNRVTYQRLLR